MSAFILQRLWQSVVVMLAVAFVSFMLFRHVGDPIVSMVGQETRIEEQEALRESIIVDRSIRENILSRTLELEARISSSPATRTAMPANALRALSARMSRLPEGEHDRVRDEAGGCLGVIGTGRSRHCPSAGARPIDVRGARSAIARARRLRPRYGSAVSNAVGTG